MEWRVDEGDYRFDVIPSTTVLSHPLVEKKSRKKKEDEENEKKEEIEEEEIFHPLGDSHSIFHDEESPKKRKGEPDTGPLKNTLKSEAITPTHEIVLPNFEGWNKMRSRMMSEKTGRNMMGGKARLRLDLLEDVSGLKKMNVSNEEEYVNEMGLMRETLLYAWKNNKRIESLKLIVEMVSSLSSLGSSPSFYPVQFALVSQVLDTFGGLVYERLLNMANQDRVSRREGNLPSSFTSNQISESVKVVAKNWFIKSSDIPDAFSRLYVTISITKCQRFFDSSSLNGQWMNLCTLCCSITNPIVAAFTRAYLSKEAMYSDPSDRSVHWKLVNDWMQNLKPVQERVVSPALEWLLSCVSYQCSSREDLAPLWEYSTHSNKRRLFLLPFLRALPPSYLATHIIEATKIVCNPSCSPSGSELKALITPLITQSSSQQNRALVLRSVWRSTMKLESTIEFVEAASVLPSLVATHFTIDEMSSLCKSIYGRLSGDPSPFQSFISNSLLTFAQSAPSLISSLITLDVFHSLLSLLIDPFESSRCSASILSSFVSHHGIGSVRDRVQSNQLLYLCSLLKQSSRMDEDDSSHNLLIISTVDRVSLSDGESVLEWLLSIRAKMSMREQVIVHVVNHASALVSRISSNQGREKGSLKLTRSTLAFIHITIPSIIDPTNRLICIERGLQAALSVAALPQAEALARLALETLAEVPSIPSVLPSLLTILILIPDSTDRQPLAFINALLNIIDRQEWKGREGELMESLTLVLDGLSALTLKTLPARMANSWSNDELYGGSEELRESIRELSGGIIDRLSSLSTSRPQDSHSFIFHLVVRCEPTEWSIKVVSSLLKSLGFTIPVKPQLNALVRVIRSREEWRRHIQV
ncbi:hypothetical protein PENTCL1PPCAC_6317 [Pristionchus entomophagus]|uniref:Uncharacterized protein n=1 Tax=Pristionchus entomophagus TaxID=358040 RepID=A0AAV5SN26_9BILA|nr:hypothetical protein PENTCL1PPCAC_6317 [Pristionchus entomophagus]